MEFYKFPVFCKTTFNNMAALACNCSAIASKTLNASLEAIYLKDLFWSLSNDIFDVNQVYFPSRLVLILSMIRAMAPSPVTLHAVPKLSIVM